MASSAAANGTAKPPSGLAAGPSKPGSTKVDCKYIRIVIKTQGGLKKEEPQKESLIQLPRKWLQQTSAIPHFSNVIENVGEQEGVEITMNCNYRAFMWVVDVIKISTNFQGDPSRQEEDYKSLSASEKETLIADRFSEINDENCLNKLVTSHFLKVKWLYERIWDFYFAANFSGIINACQISLTNLSPAILSDIARRVKDTQLEGVKERRDKFVSNVYRARIETTLISN